MFSRRINNLTPFRILLDGMVHNGIILTEMLEEYLAPMRWKREIKNKTTTTERKERKEKKKMPKKIGKTQRCAINKTDAWRIHARAQHEEEHSLLRVWYIASPEPLDALPGSQLPHICTQRHSICNTVFSGFPDGASDAASGVLSQVGLINVALKLIKLSTATPGAALILSVISSSMFKRKL